MNRVRLFLENRIVGVLGAKPAWLSTDQAISRERLIRFSTMATLIVAGVFFLAPDTAKATARSSNGTGGGTWSLTTTWAGGVVPVNGDSVTIVAGDTVTVSGGSGTANLISLTVDGTFIVAQNVNVNSGAGTLIVNGTLTYNNGVSRTITVTGNLTIASGATFNTANPAGDQNHVLDLAGNLTNGGTFNCNNGDDDIRVTFDGSANQTVSGTGGTTSFSLITVNNPGNIVEVSSTNFSAPAAFLTLTAGTLKMSGSYLFSNTFFSTAGYNINSDEGIWLNNANVTVTGQNGTPTLSGSLRVTAGTYNVGTSSGNSLKYTSGSSFTMEGGALTVTGRFVGTSATQTITFNMSGGALTVRTITANSNDEAGFDIQATGSSFTMSGGTIVIQDENSSGGPNAVDYRNRASTVSITGGTVQFGNSSTPAARSFVVAQSGDGTNVFPSLVIDATRAHSLTLITAITVRGDLTIGSGTSLLANGQAISMTGNSAPGTAPGNFTNAGTFTSGTQTTTFNGAAGQSIGGSTSTAFSGLTINNSSVSGVTLITSGSVSAILTLTTNLTTTSPAVLTQSGTSAGAADVIGDVQRTDLAAATTRSFGNVDVQVTIGATGTMTTMTVNLVKQAPFSFPSAVTRVYTLTPGGGTIGTSPTLRLRYRETPTDERNGNTEATLQLWRLEGTAAAATWQPKGGTPDTVNNYVTLTPVPGFSSWVIAGPSAPTDVAMVNMKATRFDNRVLLEWRTGYEVRNLGFNIYREQKGIYSKVNPEPVAGSALLFGPKVSLRTGFAYAWWDKELADCGSKNADCENTRYWIQDLDLSGHSSMHGPFGVERSFDSPGGKEAAPLLGAIGNNAARFGSSAPVERLAKILKPTAAGLAVQSGIASQQAVKLSVKHEGWYRVEQSDLVAAGISGNADPQELQLFVDGQEIPILVTASPASPVGKGSQPTATWDGIEFYGIGIDSAFTDSHVYWLVAGLQNGLRVNTVPSSGGAPAPATFPFAVERRDKVVYFPSLKNGGAEKFFGPLIYDAQPVDQSLDLQHIGANGLATLDVGLQGYTDAPHSVTVSLNGSDLGTVQFTGIAKGTAQYSIPQTSLLEGSNQLLLISPAGFSDISMVEYVRMTYQHTNTADGNSLRFPANGGQQTTIAGFTSAAVRVVDVTDAASPQEATASVMQDGAEYSATVSVPGAGARTLLAFAVDQKKTPASLVANQPSSWGSPKNGANYVAVTRKDLVDSFQLLIKQRKNQGLKVSAVDVEDVYDEFSFGNKTPQALKDFFSYAKSSWKIAPRFVLLAGDATYDPKNYTGAGDNDVVPTKLVETAFSETATDDWLVDFNGDQVPDIAIGRLPVRTTEEAAGLAAKIVRYDGSEANRRVVIVADQNNGYDFEAANTQLQTLIPANLSVTDIRRGQVGDPNARTQLLDALNVGAKFVNYYGHGSTLVWTNASILTAGDAVNLGNTDRLALFDAMTCFNGFFHDVSIDSLGEALLKSPGGAIAVWASSGMTDPGGQVLMNEEAIRQLFNGAELTIGEVTARAKAATGNPDVRRTWILLGDPATKLK